MRKASCREKLRGLQEFQGIGLGEIDYTVRASLDTVGLVGGPVADRSCSYV